MHGAHDNHHADTGNSPTYASEGEIFSHSVEEHVSTHDLEAHIGDLKFFDEIRIQSVEMRTSGKVALAGMIAQTTKWVDPKAPISEYQNVKALRVALQARATRMEQDGQNDTFSYAESIQRLNTTRRSVLVAAECMRGLVATNELTITGRVMRCWYWILRELYTANEPDWAIGGAAAGPDGRVSGFVTAQCVHAIVELSESLASCHELCKKISLLSKALQLIARNEVPEAWTASEKERISYSCKNFLIRIAPKLPFRVESAAAMKADNLHEYINVQLLSQIEASLKIASEGLSLSMGEINGFREQEEKSLTPSIEPDAVPIESNYKERENEVNRRKKQFAESTTGHIMGLAALEKTREAFSDPTSTVGSQIDRWENMARVFMEASVAVRNGLQGARGFLSKVIDQQLAASQLSDGHQWEPAELAFAADAYSVLTKHDSVRDEERIFLSATLVQRSLDANGTLVIRRPYYTSPDTSTNFFVPSNAVLTAIADLLRSTKVNLKRSFVERLLPGLVQRCIWDGPTASGWKTEYAAQDKVDVLETACAVDALAAINRLLDDKINNMILDHFSVRHPVFNGVGLDDLFYPDYGLSKPIDISEVQEIVHRPSCGLLMQRMRAHVTRTKQNPLHSLVLYGPAGTGKTTLVEALAQSCGVPLVEVTPSDLAKGGEAALERRARTVFEALSLLTHVVILFDEFDPILRRRDASGKKAFNYFSFLTPGMLPKLKNLSEKASKRSVAYVLITNLLGTLDEAAVRRGRFDERLAIFSPDPLARLGRIAVVAHSTAYAVAIQKLKSKKREAGQPETEDDVKEELDRMLAEQYPPDFAQRLREVAYRTGGLGMPQLTAKGWYRGGDGDIPSDTPLDYVLNESRSSFDDCAEPEDPYDRHLRGTGDAARKEAAQWWWLHQWDLAIEKLPVSVDNDILKYRPKELGATVGNLYLSKIEAEDMLKETSEGNS